MPGFTYKCPKCSTLFSSPTALVGPELFEACPGCNGHYTRLFAAMLEEQRREAEKIRLEVQRQQDLRDLVPRLFAPNGWLRALYLKIHGTSADQMCGLSWDFEAGTGPSGEGEVLAYIAQMVMNDGGQAVKDDHYGAEAKVVVVATIIVHKGSPVFIIGVNGNKYQLEYLESFQKGIPKSIAGVPVVVVTQEQEPSTKTIEKRLSDIVEIDAWSWHGEQKVINFVKHQAGDDARTTLTALGIAHIKGPCTFETAGQGTNYCYAYLEKKFKKDDSRSIKRGVAAYWYVNTSRSWEFISQETLGDLCS